MLLFRREALFKLDEGGRLRGNRKRTWTRIALLRRHRRNNDLVAVATRHGAAMTSKFLVDVFEKSSTPGHCGGTDNCGVPFNRYSVCGGAVLPEARQRFYTVARLPYEPLRVRYTYTDVVSPRCSSSFITLVGGSPRLLLLDTEIRIRTARLPRGKQISRYRAALVILANASHEIRIRLRSTSVAIELLRTKARPISGFVAR